MSRNVLQLFYGTMTTRAQIKQKIIEEASLIIDSIFSDEDPERVKEALQSENILSKKHLYRADRKQLERCNYRDNGTPKPLPETDVNNILIFQAYNRYKTAIQDPITKPENVTPEELTDFVTLPYLDTSTYTLDFERIMKYHKTASNANITAGT